MLDSRVRNLVISGLEHGVQLFSDSGTLPGGSIQKNLDGGNYTIRFDANSNQTGSNLPYSHYAMLNSSATIGEVERNARVFLSSYPDAFNLSFFGYSSTFTHSNTTFNDDTVIDRIVNYYKDIDTTTLSQDEIVKVNIGYNSKWESKLRL